MQGGEGAPFGSFQPLLPSSSRTRQCQVPTLVSGQPQAPGCGDRGNDVILLPSHCSM